MGPTWSETLPFPGEGQAMILAGTCVLDMALGSVDKQMLGEEGWHLGSQERVGRGWSIKGTDRRAW